MKTNVNIFVRNGSACSTEKFNLTFVLIRTTLQITELSKFLFIIIWVEPIIVLLPKLEIYQTNVE